MGKNKSGRHDKEMGLEAEQSISAEGAVDATALAVAENPTLMTQREAVFSEVIKVMDEAQILRDSSQPVKPMLTEDCLKKVYAGLADGFISGRISLKANENNQKKLADPKALQSYIVGLVNNWLKRDERLNGKI